MQRVVFAVLTACCLLSLNASASSLDTLKKKFNIESESSSTAPATDKQCTDNSGCSDHGTCTDGQCECDHGYLTVEGYGNCAYEQKSWGKAFGLVWINLTGAAYWYIGRIPEAMGMLGTTVVSVGAGTLSATSPEGSLQQLYFYRATWFSAMVAGIWNFVDLWRFGFNDKSVTDKHGQRLAD
jgi:hypothetical protein